ncbi:MAG: hypothetical protein WC483_03360 [Candidatus Paceibacterota bacterium]
MTPRKVFTFPERASRGRKGRDGKAGGWRDKWMKEGEESQADGGAGRRRRVERTSLSSDARADEKRRLSNDGGRL